MPEVIIGVSRSSRDLRVTVDTSPEDLVKQIEAALDGDVKVLWLTDTDNKRVGVPSDKIAWVEIDPRGDERRVGFGA